MPSKFHLPGDWQPLLNHPVVADFIKTLPSHEIDSMLSREASEAVSRFRPMVCSPGRDGEPARWYVRFSDKTFLVEATRDGLRASVAYPGGADWFARDRKAGERCVAFLSCLFPRHKTDPVHREAEPVL